MVMVAWQAYLRRRAFAAWFAGAPANFRELTFDQLSGIPPKQQTEEEMVSILRRRRLARESQQGTANDGD